MNRSRFSRLLAVLMLATLLTLCAPTALAETPAVGDKISFGRYFQESDWDDEIVWRVLDVKSDKALLISDLLLDAQAYDSTNSSSNWKDCTLRYWLNNDFLEKAFTSEEQEKILTTNVLTDSVGVTEDQIFLLSKDEVKKYFSDGKPSRMAYLTPYAASTGTWVSKSDTGWWWVRTAVDKRNAMWVNVSGGIQVDGTEMDHPGCIRPAFWMSIE